MTKCMKMYSTYVDTFTNSMLKELYSKYKEKDAGKRGEFEHLFLHIIVFMQKCLICIHVQYFFICSHISMYVFGRIQTLQSQKCLIDFTDLSGTFCL
jgi:hypothetical protein